LLHNLAQSKQTGGLTGLAGRYDAASLVFFGQATLDNVAAWLCRRAGLRISGRDCQLHKKRFKRALSKANIRETERMIAAIERHGAFLPELERYRQIWIHSLAGGADIYADKSPAEGGVGFFAVPLDPSIGFAQLDNSEYVRRVQACRDTNSGEWLEPLEHFADRFADGVKAICLDLLSASLASFD
jgi:hypothetical protein